MFFVIMFYAGWSPFFISGPRKEFAIENSLHQCRRAWWYDLVFASNIILKASANRYAEDPTTDDPYVTVSSYTAIRFKFGNKENIKCIKKIFYGVCPKADSAINSYAVTVIRCYSCLCFCLTHVHTALLPTT